MSCTERVCRAKFLVRVAVLLELVLLFFARCCPSLTKSCLFGGLFFVAEAITVLLFVLSVFLFLAP
ncbi:hypothetical protein EDD75_0358 [Thermodesulfitimonas autotrophica]|uniref:Uncharacterized protein n=1 Tax=Thermodesulfitimonas autotrophica TaxID=1894989 RepID=A0A3N5C068_9THEO|nr:hypothetical protein EDD75_0358 [Thermodesulfitimonas autotrophica]